MIDELVITQPYDHEKGHLAIPVSKAVITCIHKRLCDIVQHKALYNTTRLYVFLLYMKDRGLVHIDKKDLAAMMFSKHDIRLTKAIEALKSAGLLYTRLVQNNLTNRFYTTFYPIPIACSDSSDEDTVIYEFNLPPSTYWTFEKKREKEQVLHETQPIQSSSQCPQESAPESSESPSLVPVDISLDDADEKFMAKFISWYKELNLGNGHFSESDGRFYHMFHHMSKEERQNIRWDGEPVVEVWDAHCSFMAVLCYYLKYFKEYDSKEEKEAFMRDANTMLNIIIGDDIYRCVANCFKYHKDRKDAKILFQSYRNISRKVYFRKDGHLKDTYYARQYYEVDNFFKRHFPHIRNFILDYPTRKEMDIDRYEFIINEDNKLEKKYRLKSVSNITHDIMPYEFRLISLGVCRDIYNDYGIKTLTVHDAVYMKESDRKRLDESEGSANEYIARLFSRRLGVGAVKAKPLF